jgi:carbonic anhydrase/acetyltransferase-like protein (isoleucine patch superfamily)
MTHFKNIRPNLVGNHPQIHPEALIDPSAQIIGNVIVGKNVFVGPVAVIRADERGADGTVAPIILNEDVNIQDGVIIHSHGGTSVTIGSRTSVAHGAIIHGPCVIGEDCFIAMGSALYSATLGHSIWIGMGAQVICASLDAHTYVPTGSVIRSNQDVWSLRLVTSQEKKYMMDVLSATKRLRDDYIAARTGG